MQALLINCVNNSQWVCSISNTGISYPFYGASLDQQATNVIAFGNAMTMNQANYAVGFLDFPDGMSTAELAQQVFGTTDKLYYGAKLAYGTLEDDALLDDLVQAGKGLLIAMGIM